MSRYRYPLLVFLGGACYGILSTIVKLAYAAGIDRSGVSSGQFFFGLLLLLIPAWRARPRQLTARQVLVMLAAGVPTGGTTLFYYHALVSVSASLAVVLLFQYIVIALVLEAILRRAWPARQKLAALLLLLPGSLLAIVLFCLNFIADGLRVADSSIFPDLTYGNLNGPSIMTGEKAADHILGRSMLAPLNLGPEMTAEWRERQR